MMTDLASRIEAMAVPRKGIFMDAWEATQKVYRDNQGFLAMLDAEAWTSAAEMLVPQGWVIISLNDPWFGAEGARAMIADPSEGNAARSQIGTNHRSLALLAACVRAHALAH